MYLGSLLHLHAKFEGQEAMGSRQARGLKLLTKKALRVNGIVIKIYGGNALNKYTGREGEFPH